MVTSSATGLIPFLPVAMTFDDCFVIHGLVLRINTEGGYSLHMPQKKRPNGMHVDMVLPLDNETRKMIEEKVFAAYQVFANERISRTGN